MKLNDELNPGMELNGTQSRFFVKEKYTILDLILKQLITQRSQYQANIRLMFLNNYETSHDTLSFISKHYPTIASEPQLELLQNKVLIFILINELTLFFWFYYCCLLINIDS